MDIYFIRHTTPAIAPGVCYGQSDLGVAPSFEMEFLKLQNKLKHLEKAAIYTSPLQRCFKLAEATSQAQTFGKVIVDERLKELNFGAWEMLAWQDIPRAEIDFWAEDYVLRTPPNGESFQALKNRTTQFYAELTANSATEAAIIFTHAGVIRAILSEVSQSDLKQTVEVQIDYASVTKMVFDQECSHIAYINQ